MDSREIEYVVPGELSGERADKVFASAFQDVSRVRLQKAFDLGQVSFNGVVIDKRFKVQTGGILTATLLELEHSKPPVAVEIPLDVIFEDEQIIVINKKSGMVTHPGSGTGSNTLVHALLHHCDGGLSAIGMPDRPGIVHRLDKDTSGVMVAAKTDSAYYSLTNAFSERLTKKCYLAFVSGIPKLQSGSIKEAIGRHPTYRTRMAVQPNGKNAHTDWKLLESFGDQASLIECQIHTGRTHQIRVHMSHMGLPLLGDTLYGFKPKQIRAIATKRVCLHARILSVPHPKTNEVMTFEADLPEELKMLQAELKNTANN